MHPYCSFEPVIELINKAADDENVVAIKQLLYRVSPDSPIIKALIRAAEKGKYVSVVVELKARFDETRNINWAKQLEDAGAHVVYGISRLKTHGKALLIIKRTKKGIKRYAHLATGNYNEQTAKIYTDFSFFTSDEHIGEDISTLFNLLTGFSLPTGWNYITIAPLDLRIKFKMLISREIENAKKGLKAKIIAKMNSLADREIAELLYSASQAGVKIDLIVRGICIVRPNIKKISENITVRSIVGRFLEHARIYYFHNNGSPEYFLSSADWMSRNLDQRIEILFPIIDEKVKEIIQKVLEFQLEDNVNSWLLESTGKYKQNHSKKSKEHNSFEKIYNFFLKHEKKIEHKHILEKLLTPKKSNALSTSTGEEK